MTVVYHELLAESYLLILAPGGHHHGPEVALAHALRCAQQSGKAAVWVDCGMVGFLSNEAVRLLWSFHHQLQEQHAQLMLVHVPDLVERDLLALELGPGPCIVPTLLDAARQTRWCIEYPFD